MKLSKLDTSGHRSYLEARRAQSPQGRLVRASLAEAVSRFGPEDVMHYLHGVGMRLAAELPLPAATTLAEMQAAMNRELLMLDLGAAEVSAATTAIEIDHRYFPRRLGPDGHDSDAYIFALLEGLYSVWFQTVSGNDRLKARFKSADGGANPLAQFLVAV